MATTPAPFSSTDSLDFSATLERGADGIWYSREREPVSYLEDGNQACFELEENSFWFAHRGACLAEIVRRFPPPGTIYDVGGGNGFVARQLVDAGFPTVVVEPGETGARHARRRGLSVLCATLGTAGFAPGSLPAVGLFDVLEHIDDDAAFLSAVYRSLAPGGRLYITVPAYHWLWSDDDVAAGHFRRHRLRDLENRVRAAGFRPLFSSYLFSLLPLPLFLLRSLPSLFGRRKLPREEYAATHRPRARWAMDRLWAMERRRLASGKTIPFGSSCLFVGEKVAA